MITFAELIVKYKLNTVERYYQYMSQGNSFAPEFSKLAPESRAFWEAEYKSASEGVDMEQKQ